MTRSKSIPQNYGCRAVSVYFYTNLAIALSCSFCIGISCPFSLYSLVKTRLACPRHQPCLCRAVSKATAKVETARIFKTYKFRLHPTGEQAARLDQWFASVRWVYNAALEQRETYGRRKSTDLHGRPSIFKGCGKKTDDVIIQDSEIGWRMLADDPDLAWLTDLPAMCRQIALQDLDKAYDRFFKKQGGYPTFRSRARNNSVRFQCWNGPHANVVFGKDSVKFPRIGRIRYNRHMKPHGRFGQASIVKDGRWFYVCLTCDQGKREIAPDCNNAIGLEWSVAAPITLSDGTRMEADPGLEVLEEKAKREQRKVSRCKKGSNRRRKRVARLAATRRKQAARRKGRAHEFTTRVVREHSVIALENTKVKDLTASAKGTRAKPGKLVQEKADVNRWILNVAPYQTRQMLEYKAAGRGGTVIAVDLDDSDTATPCFACGSVSDSPRKSRANFVCGDCGHEENADLNAARNILFHALPGRAMAPREASSGFGSQGAQRAIASPSGPATMRASEDRDDGGGIRESVERGQS